MWSTGPISLKVTIYFTKKSEFLIFVIKRFKSFCEHICMCWVCGGWFSYLGSIWLYIYVYILHSVTATWHSLDLPFGCTFSDYANLVKYCFPQHNSVSYYINANICYTYCVHTFLYTNNTAFLQFLSTFQSLIFKIIPLFSISISTRIYLHSSETSK